MKKKNSLWLWGPAVVLAAGAWHYLDVRAGALESGDLWLVGGYLWLLAAAVLGLAWLGYLLCGEGRGAAGRGNARDGRKHPWQAGLAWTVKAGAGRGAAGRNQEHAGVKDGKDRGAAGRNQERAGVKDGRDRGAAGRNQEHAGVKDGRAMRPGIGIPGLEYVYLQAGLFFGILYLLVLPPLSAPDEVSHYITAYQLSSRMLGKPSNAATGHVLVRAQDMWLQDVGDQYEYETGEDGYLRPVAESTENAWPLGQTLTEDTYKVIRQQGLWGRRQPSAADSGDQPMVSVYPPVVTTDIAYIPQAAGILLARALNLNSICLVYLGRFFNLLFFVAMTFLSIKRLPFGKEVMMGAALLPMTLHLSASFSYDVMIMGCMFYLTAVCLDLAYEKEKVCPGDVAVLALLMAAAGPCKIIYGVLMGLCLLIPVRKFGGWKRWAAAAGAVALAWGLSMAMVNGQTIVSYAVRTEGDVPWTQEAGYSLAMLLHQPQQLIRMFYQTLLWQAEQYHLSMIGAWLGNLDNVLDVPYFVVVLLTGCLLCLAAKKPGESIRFPFGARVWIWVLCGACAGAAMLSMLIAWTPLSSPVISGVQGRYFLPFLPILLMSLKNDFIILTKNGNRSILYLMCCANGYVLLRLYSIVSMRL